MPVVELNGDQAMAHGAVAAGVRVVASYPGSPSSGTVETLIEMVETNHHYVEWSTNEKVAIEIGIGASIAGRRALVCAKSVGMNTMVDPLMALNLTPVHGGLVILAGDDPGGYGSQNDQDTRMLAPLLEMPWLEPATPAEGYAMIREAFELSEQMHTTVVIRETRSFTQRREEIELVGPRGLDRDLGTELVPWRFVPVPRNAVAKHRELHGQVAQLQEWSDAAPYNRTEGSGLRGIIAAGFAYDKLLDVLGDPKDHRLGLLKLGVLYPLPRAPVARFLAEHDQVLVLEENEPYVETMIKAIGYDNGTRARVLGKLSGHVHREGELFRWQIQEALTGFAPELSPPHVYIEENEADERPERESYCGECGYDRVLDALDAAAAETERDLVLVGDPGCLVSVGERLHAKYSLGSAVAVAHGLIKAGASETPVAIFGDSAFFHSAIPAICNAAYNRCDLLIIVLDNQTTMTSGLQPNPGSGSSATGDAAPILSIAEIARSCGVTSVEHTGVEEGPGAMQLVFQAALERQGLRLVIARTPKTRRQ
jgi:indolepyruvate ferredoxin oxidoreductase alpha subunit